VRSTPPTAPDGAFPGFPGFTDVTELRPAPDGRHHEALPPAPDAAGYEADYGTDYSAREVGTNRMVLLRRIPPAGAAGAAAADGIADRVADGVAERSADAGADREDETAMIAAISAHPNVVTLYRSFPAPDGGTVLVLEPAAGSLAEQVAAHGALPAQEAVAIAVAVAGALETAHRAGVVHGAVSPSTVLITRFGAPVLSGLGVAGRWGRPAGPDPHTAPEELEGGIVGPATDVYGLAATLYELLTGRPPFDRAAGESPAALSLRILRDPPPPLDPQLAPMALSDVLEGGLAKDPARRPGTAAEFAAELADVERAAGWPVSSLVVGTVAAPRRRPAPRPRPRPESLSGADAAPSIAAPSPGRARPPSTTSD